MCWVDAAIVAAALHVSPALMEVQRYSTLIIVM